MNASRRAILVNAVTAPLALALGGASSITRAAGADPLRDWVVVNTLGGLFDPDHPTNDVVTVDTNVDAVTERSLSFAREAGMTAVNITLGYVAGPVDPF
jgi:membrane dipeptidase